MSSGFASSLRRGAAVRAKEWAQVWRDPSTFGLVVVLPLILIFLFGSAVSLDTRNTPVGLVDADRSQASRQLADAFVSNQHFRVREETALAAFELALYQGTLRGFIVIPDGFERSLVTGRPAEVQLVTDASLPNTAAFLSGHARGVLANWQAARLTESGGAPLPTLSLLSRFDYNPGLESRHMLVPGAIAIVMAMIGSLLTALIMAREYERGTMEGLLATPLSIHELVLSKLAPYFLLGLGSMLICVLVAVWGYGVPMRGSVFSLLLVSAAFLAAVLGQGLLISAATKNQFAATQFALLSGFLPSLLLSGFLFEIDSMPAAIQWITYIVPARYLIPPLQSTFLVGDLWRLVLPNVAILCLFALFFYWRVTRAIGNRIA
jgi:ABC-2 type transport system permease protein